MDNVTVLIILLCGGPERCPIDLTAPAVHETVPTPSNEGNSKAAGAMSASSTYKRGVDYGGETEEARRRGAPSAMRGPEPGEYQGMK
jgi:hypothetical protein